MAYKNALPNSYNGERVVDGANVAQAARERQVFTARIHMVPEGPEYNRMAFVRGEHPEDCYCVDCRGE